MQTTELQTSSNTLKLSVKTIISYSLGHIHNDLCASMWFTYLLYFLTQNIGFSGVKASNLLLIGQVTDGLATPIVGIVSDKFKGFFGYSKRKSWHLLGTILTASSFPFIFHKCLFHSERDLEIFTTESTGITTSVSLTSILSSKNYDGQDGGLSKQQTSYDALIMFLYYVPFIIIFQIGWAINQINHFAIIPELTADEGEKNTLVTARQSCCILANIGVYLATSGLVADGEKIGDNHDGPDQHINLKVFQSLALAVTIIGLMFSTIFHLGVKEKNDEEVREIYNLSRENQEPRYRSGSGSNTINENELDWDQNNTQSSLFTWFKKPTFYTTALSYLCARLVGNFLMIFGPVYTTETLTFLPKRWVGYVPLIMYISGFCMTFLVKFISKVKKGVQISYLIGTIATILGCFGVIGLGWSATATTTSPNGDAPIWSVILVFIIFGLGSNALIVSSMELITELIGSKTISGGFVFGFMSLIDKIGNGILVVLVEIFAPCGNHTNNENCPEKEISRKSGYFENLLSYGIGMFAVVGIVGVLIQMVVIRVANRRTFRPRRNSGRDRVPEFVIDDEDYDEDEAIERSSLI